MIKTKWRITSAILLGILTLLFIVAVPAAPYLARLGVQPFCIQGEWPDLQVISCPKKTSALPAATLPPSELQDGQSPLPVIVDDDGSPDGLIALLYFLRNPLFDVRAVTISCGEAHPELFAPHIVQLLAGLGRGDIPVGVGRATPLEGKNAFPDPWRQSSDNFWDISLPFPAVSTEPTPAADLIIKTLRNSPTPVTVFLSGNHTNLAEALRIEPGIVDHIRDVHIMGGSIYVPGNIKNDWPDIDNEVAEWNIWVDPLAAKEVFASGLSIHVTPLDATNQVTWTRSDALAWKSSGSPEGVLAGELLQWMLDSWSSKGVYLWDLVAAVNTADPSLCPETPLSLDVITTPGRDLGQTVIDNRSPNASVCLNPDPVRVKERVAEIFGSGY
jgi:pyrimidine-specific ribonucleoside hydrolase